MILVRPATADDCPGIAAAHVASIRGLAKRSYTPEQISAWSADKNPSSYAVDKHPTFVAVNNGEVVGFSELRVAGHEVRAVYVSPKVVGKGVGAMLLAAVENAAKERGLKSLRLSASLNAVGFYKRQGYQETGKGAMTTGSGVSVPYTLMEKWLTPPLTGAVPP